MLRNEQGMEQFPANMQRWDIVLSGPFHLRPGQLMLHHASESTQFYSQEGRNSVLGSTEKIAALVPFLSSQLLILSPGLVIIKRLIHPRWVTKDVYISGVPELIWNVPAAKKYHSSTQRTVVSQLPSAMFMKFTWEPNHKDSMVLYIT